ncbi:hypothetical protein A8B78_21055 [Jannaschia sp. EhC01]|nr:hypothetical protein A8B78_21055 [Jannaschia sp. EhC01]
MTSKRSFIFILVGAAVLIFAVSSFTGGSLGQATLLSVALLYGLSMTGMIVLFIVDAVRPTHYVEPLLHDLTEDGFAPRAEVIKLSDYRSTQGVRVSRGF